MSVSWCDCLCLFVLLMFFFFFFFFQAEDGIRDLTVTGVQTCALPISLGGGTGLSTLLAGLKQLVGRSAESLDRKSTRLNSSHSQISYAVFCLKKKTAGGEQLLVRSNVVAVARCEALVDACRLGVADD